MRRYNKGGAVGKGPKGKRIVGVTANGKYYLTNYGSGSVTIEKGDELVRQGKLIKD